MASRRARGRASVGQRGGRPIVLICVHGLLLTVCALVLVPFVWMLGTAFKPPQEVFTADLRFLPRSPTLVNFRDAFELRPVGRWFANSLIVAVGVTVGKLAVAVPAAFALGRIRFRGHNLVFVALVGTMIVPDAVTVVPNYVLVSRLDWTNSFEGVVVPATASYLGFYVFLLRQAMLALPQDLFDAARLDGAGVWACLWDIALPLVRPAVAVAALISFLAAWNLYLWPLLVLNDPTKQTLPVGMRSFAASQDALQHWGPLMATATLAMLPPLALFVLAQRRIVSALVTSGLK